MGTPCFYCGQLGLMITAEPAIRCRYCQAPSVDEPRRTVAEGIAGRRAERQLTATRGGSTTVLPLVTSRTPEVVSTR